MIIIFIAAGISSLFAVSPLFLIIRPSPSKLLFVVDFINNNGYVIDVFNVNIKILSFLF